MIKESNVFLDYKIDDLSFFKFCIVKKEKNL